MSIAASDSEVYLVVADGAGDECVANVQIVDTGEKSTSRLKRMTTTAAGVYTRARSLDADIYHLHDPELIPFGLLLRMTGRKVIFDAHEDLPKQVMSKPYFTPLARHIVAAIIRVMERVCAPLFTSVIGATPSITDKFARIGASVVTVNNFPIPEELQRPVPWSERKDEVSYVGGMVTVRGIKELVEAMALLDNTRLNLVGRFNEEELEARIRLSAGWSKVNELGFLKRNDIADVLGRSRAGIVTYYPVPNYMEAQPNKLFEYMSAGLPVIASDFPFWREIVEGAECGLCVDPQSPQAIAEAISYVLSNPVESAQMGKNGMSAIVDCYNWMQEEGKLLGLYKKILS